MFRHRDVAIALDDVDLDADAFQLFGVHVAARAGAQEDDVTQAGALAHRLGRHLRMIVQHEVVAGEQAGQFFGRDAAAFLDIDMGVVGADDLAEYRREIVDRIHEQTLHCHAPCCLWRGRMRGGVTGGKAVGPRG